MRRCIRALAINIVQCRQALGVGAPLMVTDSARVVRFLSLELQRNFSLYVNTSCLRTSPCALRLPSHRRISRTKTRVHRCVCSVVCMLCIQVISTEYSVIMQHFRNLVCKCLAINEDGPAVEAGMSAVLPPCVLKFRSEGASGGWPPSIFLTLFPSPFLPLSRSPSVGNLKLWNWRCQPVLLSAVYRNSLDAVNVKLAETLSAAAAAAAVTGIDDSSIKWEIPLWFFFVPCLLACLEQRMLARETAHNCFWLRSQLPVRESKPTMKNEAKNEWMEWLICVGSQFRLGRRSAY